VYGIRISKTLRTKNTPVWPEGYSRLDVLLRPVEHALRRLWWATDRARYSFPPEWILEGSDEGAEGWTPLSGQSYQSFDACFAATKPAVARPGFLPTYANVISGDWTLLYGLPNDPSGDFRLLAELDELDWFAPAARFPAAVSVVVRGIDWAYWEFFARDQAVFLAVHEQLKGVHGLKVEVNEVQSDAVKIALELPREQAGETCRVPPRQTYAPEADI